MADVLTALWAAVAGVLFVVSPLFGDRFPSVFETFEAVGRVVYAFGLAGYIVAAALRITRRTFGRAH